MKLGAGRVGSEFELGLHEGQQGLPTVKVPIAGEGADIVKEGDAGGEVGPHGLVDFVTECERRMHEEGEQIE